MNRTQPKPQRHWLDLLPLEVCENIACRISPTGALTDELRYVASLSTHLRQAVLSLLSFKFDVHALQSKCTPWLPLFCGNVLEVNLAPIDQLPASICCDDIIALLTGPNVKRAAIPDHPDFLNAVARFRAVDRLTVWVSSERSREALFRTLASLNLDELVLEYRPLKPTSVCLCRDGRYSNRDCDALTAACPTLRGLRILCRCCVQGTDHPVSRLLPRLDGLQKVGFVVKDSPQLEAGCLDTVRGMECVGIERAMGGGPVHGMDACGYRLAMAVGEAVTVLSIAQECLDAGQIRLLGKCKQLSKVEIGIAAGAECTFAKVAGELPSLRSVTLWWPRSAPWDRRDAPADDEAPYGRHVDAVPGSVLAIAQAADRLTEMQLMRVRVHMGELTTALRCLRQCLAKICFSVDGAYEEDVEKWLANVLWTALRENWSLEKIEVTGCSMQRRVSTDGLGCSNCVQAAVKKLTTRNPAFNVLGLCAGSTRCRTH